MKLLLKRNCSRLILCGFLALVFSGCTKTFDIRPVQTPQNVYSRSGNLTEIQSFSIEDNRSDANKPFSTGRLDVEFNGMGNEITYLGENLAHVLGAEDIRLNYKQSGTGDINIKVSNFRLRNHRSSGFSAYFTFGTFSADVVSNGISKRVTAYFKNGKVPVWAFREVERPCYQIPLEAMIKEIAAKINRHFIGGVTPLEKVNKLIAAIDSTPDTSDEGSEHYLNVLELGYTNNPAAIPALQKLAEHKQPIMRAAALSALGMLGGEGQLPFLKNAYQSNEKLVKAMALKSIGDIGTPDAQEFLRKTKQSDDYKDEEMIKDVVDLYI